MELILLPDDSGASLASMYERAFKRAVRLFVVNAYLTEWNTSLVLNRDCKELSIIVGRDFGITRKDACKAVLNWLPTDRNVDFLVAERIGGFHPKAVIWKEADGAVFVLVGSSNLTKAAFSTNYEANGYAKLSEEAYAKTLKWIRAIKGKSKRVTPKWLEGYDEAVLKGRNGGGGPGTPGPKPISIFKLPWSTSADVAVETRRKQLKRHDEYREKLIEAFRRCADRRIDCATFYERLQSLWNSDNGNRLQGHGWERSGKGANFAELSQSFVRILDAPPLDRDGVVIREINRLDRNGNSARGAFLSEMLCLEFPESYPILDGPMRKFIEDVEFKASRGASEGAYYLELAQELRAILRQNPDYPARNLAELDTVIEHEYRKRK